MLTSTPRASGSFAQRFYYDSHVSRYATGVWSPRTGVELEAAEADLEGWQEVLSLAIGLAGRCHDAYLKARPKVRRRFNEAVLDAVHIADGKAKAEFNELFQALFLAKSSNKALKVHPALQNTNTNALLRGPRVSLTAPVFELEKRGLIEVKGKGTLETYFLKGPKHL